MVKAKLLDMGLGNDFLAVTPKAQATKQKQKLLLHSKRNHQQSKKITYGTGKNICKQYI